MLKGKSAQIVLACVAIASVVFLAGGLLIAAVANDEGWTFSFRSSSPTLPTVKSPRDFGTAREIGTSGDQPNPGALYANAYPHDADTRERRIGGPPVRFSGYTTWIDGVDKVPANHFVPGLAGVYLRVRVRIFNRDTEVQTAGASQFAVWRKGTGFRHADVVAAPARMEGAVQLPSGQMLRGWVYLYVGDGSGRSFLRYRPDEHEFLATDTSYVGIWQLTP